MYKLIGIFCLLIIVLPLPFFLGLFFIPILIFGPPILLGMILYGRLRSHRRLRYN